MSELKTPQEWSEIDGVHVLDPDGWRFKYGDLEPRSFADPISHDEFVARLGPSTVGGFR